MVGFITYREKWMLHSTNLLPGWPVPVPEQRQLDDGHHLSLPPVVQVGRHLGLDGLVQLLVVLLHDGALGDVEQRAAA